MDYVKPELADLGTLLDLTQAGSLGGTEDGSGKVVFVDTPIGDLSVGIVP